MHPGLPGLHLQVAVVLVRFFCSAPLKIAVLQLASDKVQRFQVISAAHLGAARVLAWTGATSRPLCRRRMRFGASKDRMRNACHSSKHPSLCADGEALLRFFSSLNWALMAVLKVVMSGSTSFGAAYPVTEKTQTVPQRTAMIPSAPIS